MALINEFRETGNWLFKYRSYLPIVLYPLAVLVIIFQSEILFTVKEPMWSIICLGVSMLGLLFRILVIGFVPKGTSGRNTEVGQVAETLNSKGIYSAVRHPLYVGNFLMWLGIIIYVGSFWFIIVCCLLFWLYYERIMYAEEQFLTKQFGDIYLEWASQTPAFIPRFRNWEKADLRFSIKNVLKREYNGFFATFISFALVDFVKMYFVYNELNISLFWKYALAGSFVIFITLRTLKKKTRVLHVEGR